MQKLGVRPKPFFAMAFGGFFAFATFSGIFEGDIKFEYLTPFVAVFFALLVLWRWSVHKHITIISSGSELLVVKNNNSIFPVRRLVVKEIYRQHMWHFQISAFAVNGENCEGLLFPPARDLLRKQAFRCSLLELLELHQPEVEMKIFMARKSGEILKTPNS
jgi:hypothetical protein